MTPIVHPVEVRVVSNHRLWLRFEDGAVGEVDFSDGPWRGVFAPLEDPTFFAQVELDAELGTIVWPNGADIAPETLHDWVIHGVERIPADTEDPLLKLAGTVEGGLRPGETIDDVLYGPREPRADERGWRRDDLYERGS